MPRSYYLLLNLWLNLFLFIFLLPIASFAQSKKTAKKGEKKAISAQNKQKILKKGEKEAVELPALLTVQHKRGAAKRTEQAPKIDGKLDDVAWELATPMSNFTQYSPNPGAPATFATDVKIVYTDKSVYVSAMLHDDAPPKIRKEITFRDAISDDDYFAVYLDCFDDKQNAFLFGTTAAGVQIDGRVNGTIEDLQWNTVWKSAVKTNKDGWVVEMEIPYSAFRFPDRLRQKWNINCRRDIRRLRETSYWNVIDPIVDGTVQQFGRLDSVAYIKPPMRLGFIPYLATVSRQTPVADRETTTWDTKITGGMDIKLGLGESYTLDASIVPDFGQVQSDDVVLNLTPFEIRFDENRPLFQENIDIFRRGNLLYSRRIGGRPINYNAANDLVKNDSTRRVAYNPDRANLLNTLKISGRDKRGLGFGLLNAVQGKSFAQINRGKGLMENIETDPRTNYNMIVVDKLLKNNSYISFVNTNVLREGLQRDANVTGTEFRLVTPSNMFALTGRAAFSSIYKNDTAQTIKRGYSYLFGISKISGSTRFDVSRSVDSDTYDPNDMGFLLTNNLVRNHLGISRVNFTPRGATNKMNVYMNTTYTELFSPSVYMSWLFNVGAQIQFRNFLEIGGNMAYQPNVTHDYFEARYTRRRFVRPSDVMLTGTIQTDTRKKASVLATFGYYAASDTSHWTGYSAAVDARLRLSRQFTLIPSIATRFYKNESGFADTLKGQEIFGVRNRQEIITTITANYFFSSTASVAVRARHNWTLVDYQKFGSLDDEGILKPIANPFGDDRNPNRNYNIFNLDLVYRWIFAPGSELNLIWKHSIINDSRALQYSYTQNINDVLQQKQADLISVKLLYFLDSAKLKKRKRTVVSDAPQ